RDRAAWDAVDRACDVGHGLKGMDDETPGAGLADGTQRVESDRTGEVCDPLPRNESVPERADGTRAQIVGNPDDHELGPGDGLARPDDRHVGKEARRPVTGRRTAGYGRDPMAGSTQQ